MLLRFIDRCICAFLCLLLILPYLSGCGSHSDPTDVVRAMWDGERALGEGRIYSLSAQKGSESYLSDEMLLSLYGFDRGLSGLSGGALCLSPFYYPFELAVFECESTLCAEDIALAFKNRLRLLGESASSAASFCDMTVEEYRAYINDAEVLISGRYVALIISSDVPNVKRIFLRLT